MWQPEKRDAEHGVAAHASNRVTLGAFARIPRPSMFSDRSLEILRYLSTGLLSVALNLLILVFLTHLGVQYMVAICICFISVTTISFSINRRWTFRKSDTGAQKDFRRYFSVALLQLPLSLGAFSVCVEVLHLSPPAAAVAVSAVFAPALYFLHRSWSFGLRWLHERSH
jgi:putative flippase GtrA